MYAGKPAHLWTRRATQTLDVDKDCINLYAKSLLKKISYRVGVLFIRTLKFLHFEGTFIITFLSIFDFKAYLILKIFDIEREIP